MKLTNITFFCSKGKGPKVKMSIESNNKSYPATIKIGPINIFPASLADFTNFKNDVLSAYEKAMRKEGYK